MRNACCACCVCTCSGDDVAATLDKRRRPPTAPLELPLLPLLLLLALSEAAGKAGMRNFSSSALACLLLFSIVCAAACSRSGVVGEEFG